MAEFVPLTPGTHRRTINVDGRERTYLLHAPPSYDAGRTYPLLLAFHGGATDAAFMARFCGLNEKSDEAGFLVIYPNGTGEVSRLLTWNAGNCCGYARRQNIDDVQFVNAILDEASRSAAIDERRIYATGMSNGAMMSYRLAAELSERIAAIAPVAGTMALDAFAPDRPVPVIHFHGTEDDYVPFDGGRGPLSLSQNHFASVAESIRRWADFNGCRPDPTITDLPNVAADGLAIECREYTGGRDGTEVVLYVVAGGGHTWPGRESRITALGPSTLSISANDLMWEFFVRHPLR
ncbi:MAG TPA: PHB depolymerase family esterase [Pirellulales bacterium]|jgi:polyhydroxybutyrate depolymerase